MKNIKRNVGLRTGNFITTTTTASVVIFSILLLVMPIIVSAQSFSGVTGVVTDTNGGIVPNVEVKLTDTKTSRELTTKTNDQGVYIFNNVAPGQGYTLTFSATGFKTLVLSDISLGVGTKETHNAELSIGQVAETVQVVAETGDATLNTTDPSIGNVFGERQLRNLPIQIRNSPAALISLQPGVVGDNVGTADTNRIGSVTGSRADQGNITVDGIDANDQATGQAFATTANAPIDSIQEFRTVSTNPGASEGRSSGGQILLVTKSGTNEFHGTLREYNRTAATSANSFFNNKNGIERPQLTRNQFGGSFSGPLYFPAFGEGGRKWLGGKDKAFFFFDYEGRRDAQGVSYLRVIPLDHFRNGQLGYINNNAGCTGASRLNTAPSCITLLSQAQITGLDPRGTGGNTALLSFVNSRYPRANDLSVGDGINTGGHRFNAPSKRTEDNYTARIDWNINSSQKVFGRFTKTNRLQTDTVNTVAQQFPGDPESGQISDKSYAIVGGHSWVVTPNLFNQFTIGLAKSAISFPIPFAPAFPNEFNVFGNISDPFATIGFQARDEYVPTIRDDLTWTRGSHNFQFGGLFKPIRSNTTLVNDFNFVTIGLGGTTTTLNASLRPGNILGSATARDAYDNSFALLLGRFGSVTTNFNYDTNGSAFAPGTGKTREYVYDEYEFYAQDNWRIRSDLTLNMGVRWHYYRPPFEKNGFQSGTNVDYRQLLDTRIRNAANGISGPAAEPLLSYDLIGAGNNARSLYKPDRNNFGPRLGFAYNPSFKGGLLGAIFGDRKTSIRGGGALVYDRVGGTVTFLQDQISYLFDNSATTSFGSANPVTSLLNDPRFTSINSLPVANTPPVITRPFTPFVTGGVPTGNATGEFNYVASQNFRTPYSIQYSLGIQRELPGNLLLDVSYVGRQGKKLFAQSDAAQILDFRDNASGQFMIDAFNRLQAQIQAGGAISPQPWFENQIGPAAVATFGADCTAFSANCTELVADFFGGLIEIGDTADAVQALYANGLLNPNVGLSSQFSVNSYVTNQSSSSYNGMLVSLQKRFSKGFEFDFNYTLSHSIDNQSSVVNTVIGGLLCDVRNLRVCRGDSDFDIRHLVNVNGIYELPVGKGRYIGRDMPGWLDMIVGGWTVSGIFVYRSGLPLSTTTGSFPVGFFFDSPAVLNGNSSAFRSRIRDEGTGIQYFADQSAVLNALRFPRHGETGNRNTFRGPSFWNLDTAVAKKFRLPWEGHFVSVRWESFNAFNHHSFGVPNLDISSGSFGRITTSASAPRVMQFGIRYDF